VDLLLGDASKAHEKLGWKPRTSFAELVRLMTDCDWQIARQESGRGARGNALERTRMMNAVA
jgi:GDPmannose 4,6-dehydratase